MSLILSIDTSTENASICLAYEGNSLFYSFNDVAREHSAWLHPAIQEALRSSGKKAADLKAIGITAGPGSYTGLRVAMATAKGLCYSLNIPLVSVNTLEAMASVAVEEETDYICPMIDAKRMEVFTALYDKNLRVIIEPAALILDKNSFSKHLEGKKILFFGNGKNKFQDILLEKNATFKNLIFNSLNLSQVIYKKFTSSEFTPLSAAEPVYLKEHYTLYIAKS